jgi:hypothetical protein
LIQASIVPPFDDAVARREHCRRVGDVSGNRQRLAAPALDLAPGGVEPFRIARKQCDAPALAAEPARDLAARAGTRARDDDDPRP